MLETEDQLLSVPSVQMHHYYMGNVIGGTDAFIAQLCIIQNNELTFLSLYIRYKMVLANF